VSDIKRILNGGRIDLDGYSKIPGLAPVPQSYLLDKERVILIEGVIGLALPYLLEISDLKIFHSVPEDAHRIRVMEYFDWKGYSLEKSEQQYAERKAAEYDFISGTSKNADLVI
jgi:uridine kinase